MRILLVNDASNNGHLGCSAVANALRVALSERNSAQVYPIFNRQLKKHGSHLRFADSQMAWFCGLLKWCDLVLINGEGSLHHGRAPELEVAMHCALEAKKPFFVVNSIFEDYPRLVPLLKQAGGISLRDRLSWKQAEDSGVPAELCCDAALFAAFASHQAPKAKSGTATTDWHGNAPAITHVEMSRFLNLAGVTFLPFRSPTAVQEWPQIINRLTQYARVVSGRYHGTLFSIMAGTPVTMLPSNSHKVEALAREFSMQVHPHDVTSGNLYSLEGEELDTARRQLIESSSDKQLHPLHVLELGSKIHAVPIKPVSYPADSPIFIKRGARELEIARLIADEIKQKKLPLRRKQRLQLRQQLSVRATVLKNISEFLLQEGFAEHNSYVKDALLSAEDEQAAFDVSLRSYQARPASAILESSLAVMLARVGDHYGAYEIFKRLDVSRSLTGHIANLAARSANRVGDYAAALRLLSRTLDEKKPESFVRAAVAASRAGKPETARELAWKAYENAPLLSEWPAKNIGNILAANGLLSHGLACMGDALRRHDPKFSYLRELCGNAGTGTAVYFPESFGVGSAMLALTLMASKVHRLSNPITLIVDPRLTSSAQALLGSNTTCRSDEEIDNLGQIGRMTTAFDIMKELTTEGVTSQWKGSVVPDRRKVEELSSKLREKFPNKKLYGLTWFTPNARTGSGRNVALGDLRDFVKAFPEIQFVSLQPDNRAADFDLNQVVAENVHIELTVDPLEDIDDQLCLIASLDKVVGIDSSAMHFSGALGKDGVVLLSGEPTWQWPLRTSFYSSISTVRSLDELQRTMAATELSETRSTATP